MLSLLPLLLAGCGGNHLALSKAEVDAIRMADTARSLGRMEEAKKHYQKATVLSHGAVRAHLDLAAIHQEQGNLAAAINVLEQAYGLNSKSQEVLKELARLHLARGENERAHAYITKGLARYPEDVRLMLSHGLWLDRNGQYRQAQDQYREVLALASAKIDREAATNNLGLSFVASGDYGKAIALLKGYLPKATNKMAFRQALALAYGADGKDDEAYNLGLQDLSLAAVKENMAFYRNLREGKIPPSTLFESAASP